MGKQKTIDLFGHEWIIGMEGGRRVHPKHPNVVFTDDCVKQTNYGVLLNSRKLIDPIITKYWDGNEYLSNYASGGISSKESFSYGIFTANCILPEGSGQHAAFWLSGFNSWPPEIDCFETYVKLNGGKMSICDVIRQLKNPYTSDLVKCNCLMPTYRIQPNVHWGTPDDDKMCKVYNVPFNFLDEPYTKENKYKVIWTPYRITILYNGYEIFNCTDDNVLNWFNADPHMRVIFSNGYIREIQDGVKDVRYTENTPFVITNFTYQQI